MVGGLSGRKSALGCDRSDMGGPTWRWRWRRRWCCTRRAAALDGPQRIAPRTECVAAAGRRFATGSNSLPAVAFSSEQAKPSPDAVAYAPTVDGNIQAVGACRATGRATRHCTKTVAPGRSG